MPYSKSKEYKEYMKIYTLRRYHEKRKNAVILLGGKCVDCGYKHDLKMHHKNLKNRTMTHKKMWSSSQVVFLKELEKFYLLCKLCSKEKSKKDISNVKGLTHGAYHAYYRKKCRCDECEEFHLDYLLMRKEDRAQEKLNTL